MASTDSTNLPASRNPATRPGATDFDRRLGLKSASAASCSALASSASPS
jgi:hypothetical protein